MWEKQEFWSGALSPTRLEGSGLFRWPRWHKLIIGRIPTLSGKQLPRSAGRHTTLRHPSHAGHHGPYLPLLPISGPTWKRRTSNFHACAPSRWILGLILRRTTRGFRHRSPSGLSARTLIQHVKKPPSLLQSTRPPVALLKMPKACSNVYNAICKIHSSLEFPTAPTLPSNHHYHG